MSLATNVTNLATRVATEAKALRTLINGNAAGLSGLNTTDKTNLVAAINEIEAAVSASSGINDGVTSTSTTWSSTKVNSEIGSRVSALVDGAPTTLDTLNELAAALADDAAFSTTVTAALANRVRVDAAQGLTAPQQTQARTNIDAASTGSVSTLSTNVGDTTADFVATFNAGLV